MNAKEKMLHNHRMKEQFEKHINHSSKTYPTYESYKKKFQVDFVEFGRAFDLAPNADQTVIAVAYHMAVEDFFKEQAINFPTWDGLPEIKVNNKVNNLATMQGAKQIGWYAQVPKKYVVTDEQKIAKLDEELWNS